MALHEWTDLTPDGAVRVSRYSFGFGRANTIAARLDDGGWLVVSPSAAAPDESLEALAKDGPVRHLLAPNGFHHLGQRAWRARFPDTTSWAPRGALARLATKCAGVPFEAAEDLGARLGARFAIVEPAGMKQPELLVRIDAGERRVWLVGDIVSNTGPDDTNLLPRMIFTILGGGGGYRINPLPSMVYLRDKKAWRRDVAARLRDEPPAVVVPGHGAPVTEDAAARTLALGWD